MSFWQWYAAKELIETFYDAFQDSLILIWVVVRRNEQAEIN